MTDRELLNAASRARKDSYSPYSHFCVGAALLCADGTVYTGCNIENAAFSPSICAERTAVFKAVSEGRHDFLRLAVTGGRHGEEDGFCPPCGVCRQVLREFCNDDFVIVLSDGADGVKTVTLKELLPLSFNSEKL